MAEEEPTTSEQNDQDEEHAAEQTTVKKSHKHDSGAADLEKVTDFAEDKEVAVSASADLNSLVKQDPGAASAAATKVTIRKEDVELIMHELEVPKSLADRKLRDHRGDVKSALKDILGFA